MRAVRSAELVYSGALQAKLAASSWLPVPE